MIGDLMDFELAGKGLEFLMRSALIVVLVALRKGLRHNCLNAFRPLLSFVINSRAIRRPCREQTL